MCWPACSKILKKSKIGRLVTKRSGWRRYVKESFEVGTECEDICVSWHTLRRTRRSIPQMSANFPPGSPRACWIYSAMVQAWRLRRGSGVWTPLPWLVASILHCWVYRPVIAEAHTKPPRWPSAVLVGWPLFTAPAHSSSNTIDSRLSAVGRGRRG